MDNQMRRKDGYIDTEAIQQFIIWNHLELLPLELIQKHFGHHSHISYETFANIFTDHNKDMIVYNPSRSKSQTQTRITKTVAKKLTKEEEIKSLKYFLRQHIQTQSQIEKIRINVGTKSCIDEIYYVLNGKQDKHTVNLNQFLDLNVEYTYQQFSELLTPLNQDFQRIQETKC